MFSLSNVLKVDSQNLWYLFSIFNSYEKKPVILIFLAENFVNKFDHNLS